MAEEDINPLDLPDDEVDNALQGQLVNADTELPDSPDDGGDSEDNSDEQEGTEETETVSEEAQEDDRDELQEEEEEDTSQVEKSSPDGSEELTEASETEELDNTDEIDYKQVYDQLFEPFKANGKEMKVDSIDDARQLMQMGANYNKKMAALKPHLKIVKMLENNDLLDESKLSFLIDLEKKNPEAIQKLLKDSGVDPLDIDTSSEAEYKPNTYTVSDNEVELDGILDEIKETESFNRTIDVLGNKWDAKSKEVVVQNPSLIKVINDHVATGIYDQIVSVVERERMLGRLTGLSDIEAYKQVGDALNAQGAFNKSQPQSNSQTTNVQATNTNKVDPKLKSRKKAASSTKSKVVTKSSNDDFNPLSMSDEEFEKMSMSKYI